MKPLLIPVQRCSRAPGVFRWPEQAVLATPSADDALPLGQLAADLSRRCHVRAALVRNAFGPAALRVRRDPRIAGREAYRIRIGRGAIEIAASAAPGAYYAVQTLRELVAAHGRDLPACEIDDHPDFARRGVYHDCSRGKVPTLATLKALVERLARWKINELQLYIENVFTFAQHPAIGRGYSPFTPDDLLDLQDHCRQHHIRLVGSLASFGHTERILALPEYRHLGELPGHGGFPGGSTLCPTDPRAIRFVAELYDEFLPLFEAADFNVCCDETWELGKGRSRRQAEHNGVGRLYLGFLRKLLRLCERHGKRMNAWADIVLEHPELLAEVPRDIVMLNWDYVAQGARIPRTREIAAAGLPFLVCPGTSSWQSHGSVLSTAIGNVANFAREGRRQGAEGLLNTDWGDAGHRNFLGLSLHGFAHGAAHAWNGRAVDDAGFTDTFCAQVFDQSDGRLARALRLVGSTFEHCGTNQGSDLYHALVEPLLPREPLARSRIDAVSEAGMRAIIAELADGRLWPKPPKGADDFDRLAFREFRLAARMDRLAARRVLAAKRLRAGIRVPASELRALGADMRRLAADFRALWLARNRPSRLRDNLALFERAQRECARLAEA